jgi:competence protein ComEA
MGRPLSSVIGMVRPSREAEFDERGAARERLEAMRLRAAGGGWVPEPAAGVVSAAPIGGPDIWRDDMTGGTRPSSLPVGELVRGWVIDRSPPWSHRRLESLRLRGVLAALGVVAALIVVGVVVVHHRAAAGSSPYGYSGSSAPVTADPATSAAPTDAGDAGSIVVDVGGRVRKPGLVTLPAGARVADALAAAGGPLHHKEIATLDLAARVSDGQLLLVGVKDDTSAEGSDGGDSSTSGTPAPVGLNAATIEQLETLPGVGPVTAQKIIDWRTAHNGFTTVMQLQQVSGIGPAKYAELSPLVTP